jgi:hypothetical protein
MHAHSKQSHSAMTRLSRLISHDSGLVYFAVDRRRPRQFFCHNPIDKNGVLFVVKGVYRNLFGWDILDHFRLCSWPSLRPRKVSVFDSVYLYLSLQHDKWSVYPTVDEGLC